MSRETTNLMKTAIIDNYDSFTYNLAHLVKSLGADVTVLRNDKFAVSDLQQYDKLILSPGPGIPSEAGLLLNVVRTYAPLKPILGVCLGHQAIGEAFGGRLRNISQTVGSDGTVTVDPLRVFHGVATEGIHYANDYIFAGIAQQFVMGRYHSWVVDEATLPPCLEITAKSAEGQIMALRHRDYDVHGIQFHPESILTPDGETIVGNFLMR